MILLDTNVLSELMREAPDRRVVRWLDQQPRAALWTTAITVLEVRFGLAIMPDGQRAAERRAAFDRLVADMLQSRVAPFDLAAAASTAALMGSRQRRGEPGELRDSMIAGIALARKATIATRNVKHFGDPGLTPIDPWQA